MIAAKIRELVALQAPDVTAKVAADVGGGGVTAAVKVAVVVLLLWMLRHARVLELDCDTSLLIASEGPDGRLLRNNGDNKEKKQQ